MYRVTSGSCLRMTGWSLLRGIRLRLMNCAGCNRPFGRRQPAVHMCRFRRRGFQYEACGVAYHAGCIRSGPPFTTRLEKDKGLIYPLKSAVAKPNFICELCQVRAVTKRELRLCGKDVYLLMFERMRLIDALNWWQTKTLAKYGSHLQYLKNFGSYFGCEPLRESILVRPPVSPALPLMWAQLCYSLRRNKQGEQLKQQYVRQLRAAAGLFYRMDLQDSFPGQASCVGRRVTIAEQVSPTDEAVITAGTKGMERRMGTESHKSYALSHVHIAGIDRALEESYQKATDSNAQHDTAVAGTTNLLAYLGWLRGGEFFMAVDSDLQVIEPHEGAFHGLKPGLGAVTLDLLPETKSDPSRMVDVVMAFETLSGLQLGKWCLRMRQHASHHPGQVFSTNLCPIWTSRYFREMYAWPILESLRLKGEPTLQLFSAQMGNRIQDKVYSMHSWRRAGRSRVSRAPRYNEPNPPGTRMATRPEVFEHGRWEGKSEDMPAHYNQWELCDRVAISLCCM